MRDGEIRSPNFPPPNQRQINILGLGSCYCSEECTVNECCFYIAVCMVVVMAVVVVIKVLCQTVRVLMI